MKKILCIIIVLLLIVIAILGTSFYWYVRNNSIVDKTGMVYQENNTVSENNNSVKKDENIIDENTVNNKKSDDKDSKPKVSLLDVGFSDNQCLAIGYVLDEDENQFADIYFKSRVDYYSMPVYDFRYPDSRVAGYGNRFVIIPKNENVKITVYDCYVEDDGQLYTDNTLIDGATEPFVLLDDYVEVTPNMCVRFEYNGFDEMFPIIFNGENGHLDIQGCESEVRDISLYTFAQ